MKKLFLTILMLFNFSFAGEIGYILLDEKILDIKKEDLKDLYSVINLPKKTILYKDSLLIEEFVKQNKEKKCKEINECNTLLNKKDMNETKEEIKALILNYVQYDDLLFILVEDVSNDKNFVKRQLSVEKESEKLVEKAIPLCKELEEISFSCSTNKKTISLCFNNKEKTLIYRYGKNLENIELEYSSKLLDDINKFYRYGENSYSKGSTYELEFQKGKYVYTLFSENHVYKDSLSGILVKKDNRDIASITCLDDTIENHLYQLKKLFNIKINEPKFVANIGE